MSEYNPKKHHRKSIRLKDYDYTQPGAYFVTICTLQKIEFFASPRLREIAHTEWYNLPSRFPTIRLDKFVVMPNHVHFIVWLRHTEESIHSRGLINQTPTFKRPSSAKDQPALGEIIRAYKAAITRRIRQSGETGFGWQRNYYEHIIRDETSLNAIREYIQDNPTRWHLDRYNVQATGNDQKTQAWWNLLKEISPPETR